MTFTSEEKLRQRGAFMTSVSTIVFAFVAVIFEQTNRQMDESDEH